MALTIDNLEIKIESNAKGAMSSINKLADSLGRLKTAIGDTSGLASNLTQIATALKSFSGVGKINLTAKINQLKKFQDLTPTLGGAGGIQLADNLRQIAESLKVFSAIPKSSVNIGTVAKQIKDLNSATLGFNPTFSSHMRGIADGLSQLNGVGKTNLSSTISAMKKLPEITAALNTGALDAFAAKMRQLTDIMSPLASKMDAVARGFNALPKSILRVLNATNKQTKANQNLSSSYGGLFTKLSRNSAKFWTLYYTIKRITNVFAGWFKASNEYIESLNLFRVSLGEASDAALEYAETVSEAMGIDVAEWITNQGAFTRMATGFGIASDQAFLMGQNLTQLAYDMSSFFNVDVETAMQKLQSGMSGQIKGLKAWGYNLSVAALQETALSLGIEQSVRTMTEAQKAQLRYITLIQKSNGIMGDMAKTIQSPSNALRVLKAQMTELRRALGNVISVLVTKFIPWIMAAVELVAELAEELAEAWGFEVMEFPEVDLELGAEVEEETEEAEDALNELKKQLMGFDELNILKNDKDDEKLDPSYDLGIELPEYDFMAGLDNIDLEPYKQKLLDIWEVVKNIGLAFLAWKVTTSLVDTIGGLKSALDKFSPGVIKKGVGIALMVTGYTMEFSGAYEIGYSGEASLSSVLKTLIGSALGIAGSLIVFGTGPVGWTVGITLAISMAIAGVTMGKADKEYELLSKQYYNDLGEAIGGVDEKLLLFTGSLGGNAQSAKISRITMNDLRVSIKHYFDSMDFQKNDEWVKKIEASEKAYEDANYDCGLLWTTLSQKPTLDDQDIVDLTEAFNNLVTAIKNLNSVKINSVMAGIKTAIENNITPELNDRLGGLIDKLNMANTLIGVQIDGLNSEFQQILNEIRLAGGKITDSQKTRLAELHKELTKFALTDNTDKKYWEASVEEALSFKIIDVGKDKKDVMQNVTDLTADRDKYLETLKVKYAADVSTLEQLIKLDKETFGGQLGFTDITYVYDENGNLIDTKDVTDILKESYEAQIKKVSDTYESVLNKIYTGAFNNLVDKLNWSYDKVENYVNAGSVEKTLIEGQTFVETLSLDAVSKLKADAELFAEVQELLAFIGEKSKLKVYASGGFPTVGEMFIAREAGPELVGRIGNKTTVANNDQITEGIASAVYEAMMAAQSSNGSSNARIIVQIGDTAVGEAAVRFINGQIVQTGASPINAY